MKRDWYDSYSHRELGGEALHLGPFLFYLADPNWDKDGDDAVPILDGWGDPMSASKIAERAKLPKAFVKKGLSELVRAGTLDLRDGVYVLPRFGRHQESESAKRQRKTRKVPAQCGAHSQHKTETSHSSSSSYSHSPSETAADLLVQIREVLEANGIAFSESAYVVQDVQRAIANRDFTIGEIDGVLKAYDAGRRPSGVERLRLFQRKNRDRVRATCLGESKTTLVSVRG